jgi:hypothetical protein
LFPCHQNSKDKQLLQKINHLPMEEILRTSLYLIYLRLLRSPYFLFACPKHVQVDLIGMQIHARANPALSLKRVKQGIIGILMHVPVRRFLNRAFLPEHLTTAVKATCDHPLCDQAIKFCHPGHAVKVDRLGWHLGIQHQPGW